jgi:hypothetical protein
VFGHCPLGEPEGEHRGEQPALEALRCLTPITSTRLPPFAGVALISQVLPGLKMFESVTVPFTEFGSDQS